MRKAKTVFIAYNAADVAALSGEAAKEGSAVLAMSQPAEQAAAAAGLALIYQKDYKSAVKNSSQNAIDFMKRVAGAPIGGTTLKKILLYGRHSLWWVIRSRLCYTSNAIDELVRTVDILDYMMGAAPEKIVYPTASPLTRLFADYAASRQIACGSYGRPRRRFFKPPYLVSQIIFKEATFLSRFALASVLALFSPKNRRRNRVLVMLHQGSWMQYLDPIKKQLTIGDELVQPVIDCLENKGCFTETIGVGIPVTAFNLRRMIEQSKYSKVPRSEFEESFSPRIFAVQLMAITRFRREWRRLREKSEFRVVWTYKGVSLWGSIAPLLKRCFDYYLAEAVKNVEMAKALFEREAPHVIFLYNETGPLGLCVLAAAAEQNIPVIAIQHGILSEKHLDYRFEPSKRLDDTACPIPTKTLVNGVFFKNILEKKGRYPLGSVVATGHPKYDGIKIAREAFSRQESLKNLGLDPTKKTVLFAAQGFSLLERTTTAAALFKAMKLFPDAQVAIRLHPGEPSGAVYEKVAADLGYSSFAVAKPSLAMSLFEALNLCDVLVTINSTVVMEAALFGKPAITLNLSGAPDLFPFAKEGIAIGTYSEKQLEKALRSALYERPFVARFNRGAAKLLNARFANVGTAYKKVAAILEKYAGK